MPRSSSRREPGSAERLAAPVDKMNAMGKGPLVARAARIRQRHRRGHACKHRALSPTISTTADRMSAPPWARSLAASPDLVVHTVAIGFDKAKLAHDRLHRAAYGRQAVGRAGRRRRRLRARPGRQLANLQTNTDTPTRRQGERRRRRPPDNPPPTRRPASIFRPASDRPARRSTARALAHHQGRRRRRARARDAGVLALREAAARHLRRRGAARSRVRHARPSRSRPMRRRRCASTSTPASSRCRRARPMRRPAADLRHIHGRTRRTARRPPRRCGSGATRIPRSSFRPASTALPRRTASPGSRADVKIAPATGTTFRRQLASGHLELSRRAAPRPARATPLPAT